jgi:adenosylmethionine-8-amino-7-oxononanoate transaminase
MTWIKRDLRTLWHPYTQMKDCETLPPILIERAQGLSLFDDQGKEYWDTISSWWCNIHGHNHPKICEAINKQLKTLDHVLFAGFTHRGAIELGERLVDITPEGLSRVFYSDNGSTAVEVALKMSLQYWRNSGKPEKCQFVGLDKAYHGDTVGAMSVSGSSAFNEAFASILFETHKVPTPNCYHCPAGKAKDQCKETCSLDCITPLEDLLKAKHDQIAALIMEPLLMGAAGMIIYPAEYLKQAAKLAQKYNVHLILDEVATGFGRTGRMFACEHAKVSPDFLCMSKGLTSGTLPFAVTMTTDAVFDAFYDDYDTGKTLYHGHTYAANPIGCAAAMATLDIFEEENTLACVQHRIPGFAHRLKAFENLKCVGDVRTIGFVAAMELVQDKATKTPFDAKQRIGLEVFKQGLKQGLILRPMGNAVYLYLPLCVTDSQLSTILDKTYNILKQLET